MKLRLISESEGTTHCVVLDNGEALEGISRVDVVTTPGDIPRLVIELIDFEAHIGRKPKGRIFMDEPEAKPGRQTNLRT